MAPAMKDKPNKSKLEGRNCHRFFVEAGGLHGKDVVLSGRQAHQICNVLRLKQGQRIIVLDNEGGEYEVELTIVNKKETRGHILQNRQPDTESHIQITLFQSMLAREKFELVLQKCTEVGVAKFVPIIAERGIVQENAIKTNKLERWHSIIREAAEQSHRALLPQLDSPIKYNKALEKVTDFDCAMLASPAAKGGLKKSLTNYRQVKTIGLFIGPEGGFSQQEIDQAKAKGVFEFGMGPRILRTETAAVIAAALILYELGEMEN